METIKAKTDKKLPDSELSFNFHKNINGESTDDYSILDHFKKINSEESTVLNHVITRDEIMESVLNLKNNKAPGLDNIVNEYISTTIDIFPDIYVTGFNSVLDTN